MATTIALILDRAARHCSVEEPDNWLTATKPSQIELRDDFLYETVSEVLERADWPEDIGQLTTISGDGSTEYDLDASFLRLSRGPYNVQETTDALRRPVVHVKNLGDWKALQETEMNGLDRYFKLEGGEGAYRIAFFPILQTGDAASVSWISGNWVEGVGGGSKSSFSVLTDVSRLPRRLLETGIVWRFRERHGLSYGHKYDEYTELLSRYITDLRGRAPLVQAGRIGRGRDNMAYPWAVPTS